MADTHARIPANAPGALYVDRHCIDCERCQTTAPRFFRRETAGHSLVQRQPEGDADWAECRAAIAGCPVGAIGEDGLAPAPLRRLLPDLWACQRPSPLTDGAQSYLIVRPDGNLLVDVPAFEPSLVRALQELGDLRYIFVTHGDTLGELDAFQLHFGAEVVMHAAEADQAYLGVARPFEAAFELAPDLSVVPTPGHSPGSSCLLWRRHGGCLFTGDHLLPVGEGFAPVRFDWTSDWERQRAEATALLALSWHHAFPAREVAGLAKGFVFKGRDRLATSLA